jgi:predicted AlkP superfamily pyrophosphatase or phosphodiesterase
MSSLARTGLAALLAATTLLAPPASLAAKPRKARPVAAVPAPVKPGAPRLIVAISIDQLSADEFAQNRQHYTGGFARLLQGAVFPSGYQAHAATETCPGHSTLLTGDNPARTGIIANTWMAPDGKGGLQDVYCAEDETNRPATGYTASAKHLLVPTLGERMKARWPSSRNVAVSGKDRAALMMGGHNPDAVYWRQGNGFATLAGRTMAPEAQAASDAVAKLVTDGAPGYEVPAWCAARDRAVTVGSMTVGANHLALKPGDANGFVRSPRVDEATIALAEKLVETQQLGADAIPDVLSISLSANDYIGHAFGTNGVESCIEMAALDRMIGELFDNLDARGIDYSVVLSADHGGIDLPERASQQGQPSAHHVSAAWIPDTLGKAIAGDLGMAGPVFEKGAPSGDLYFNRALPEADRARVTEAVRKRAAADPDVAAVFTAAQLAATPLSNGDPRTWSLAERARASFHPDRSGDLIVLLAPLVSPIPVPGPGYVATHGSAWDYDRRVPMLFWRKGMTPFEQPLAVRTIDIAPTLASTIGLPVAAGDMDGRCLDLDGGEGDSCK